MYGKPLHAPLSRRFDTSFQMRTIHGKVGWGNLACWAHNRAQLSCIALKKEDATDSRGVELYLPGIDPTSLNFETYSNALRLFRYGSQILVGRLVAAEEWINHKEKNRCKQRIVVFDSIRGEEIADPSVEGLTTGPQLVSKLADLELKLFPTPPTNPSE